MEIKQRIEISADVSGVYLMQYGATGQRQQWLVYHNEMDAVRAGMKHASPAWPFLYFGYMSHGNDEAGQRIIGAALYINGEPLRNCEGDLQHTAWLDAQAGHADASE